MPAINTIKDALKGFSNEKAIAIWESRNESGRPGSRMVVDEGISDEDSDNYNNIDVEEKMRRMWVRAGKKTLSALMGTSGSDHLQHNSL